MIIQSEERKGTSTVRTVKRIGSREARNNFSDLIGLVYYNGETIVVERSGKPVAAIIPFDLYERIATETTFEYPAAGERRADVLQELRALFKATQAEPVTQTISEEEIAAEIAAYRAGK
jgi:prevent-host-death family protein